MRRWALPDLEELDRKDVMIQDDASMTCDLNAIAHRVDFPAHLYPRPTPTENEFLGFRHDATRGMGSDWSSCAQMTTNPTSNTNTMVLGTEAAYRCFASIERVGFFAIAWTMNVRKIRAGGRAATEVR